LKQIDYDYSLIDIEENDNFPLLIGEGHGEVSSHQASHSEQSEESRINNLTSLDSSTSLRSSLNDNITQNENKSQETPIPDHKIEDDEDLKNRAKIFRTF
jgi:hypothetical protein